MKTILYNYWGFLSNRIGISAPDGNASYSPWIINELSKRGFIVYGPPIDRDLPIINKHGIKNSFAGFAQLQRIKAYNTLHFVNINYLPDNLDYLLLQWRFKTPYNSLDKNDKNYCPDLQIQNILINKYKNTKTKIVILDLDYNLTLQDINNINPYKILQQGSISKYGKCISLGIDFNIIQELQRNNTKNKDFSYVGNEYERENDIKNNIAEYSKLRKNSVHFYGNWTRDDKKWFRDKYPYIIYHDRIGIDKFNQAMSDSIAVPLLARDDYKKNGFMTFRFVQAIMFGSLPLGFSDFYSIKKFLPDELIVQANNVNDCMKKIDYLRNNNIRNQLRHYLIVEKIKKLFSIENFIQQVLC